MSAKLVSIISCVALRIIDQFIQEEGYGWLKKLFFPKKTYKKRLAEIIYETINEFECSHSYDTSDNKFPFYHSEVLFTELNKYILFNNQKINIDEIKQSLSENSNIILPNEDELNSFYELFVSKTGNDETLKNLYIGENYKSKIFEMGNHIEGIASEIKCISQKVDDLHVDLSSKPYKVESFTPIQDYIPRQISTTIDKEDVFFTSKPTYPLYDIIVDENKFSSKRFVLYSGAQTGKTTELKNVAYQLQKKNSQVPFLVNLNGFVPEKTFSRIVKTTLAHKNSVLLLDAYDEIKDINKDDFIRELKAFVKEFPNILLIISSRKNFEDANNFSDFQPLYLEPLSNYDINNYFINRKVEESHLFLGRAYELSVFELLRIPFYLKEMLKYFLSHDDLPKTKSELYQILIDESFNIDEKHKQKKGYVKKLRTEGYKLLQKVAFIMTICEKKELDEKELDEILSVESFQITMHFSIFKRNPQDLTYSFEHIAFKEFLVADFLKSISSDKLADLIFYPDSNKLINSWYNIVLLFLEITQDEPNKFQSIIDVLLKHNTHIIVEALPNFLTKSNRIEIFKQIYNDYKSKGLYIDFLEFRKSLMSFANYQETILFLTEQLNSDTSVANHYNALVLSEFVNYDRLSNKENVKDILKNFLSDKLAVSGLQNYLFIPFQNEVFANKKDIEEIGRIIEGCRQPKILNAYIQLLLKLENVDKYADWIFSIEKYIHDYRDNNGVYHFIYRTDLYDIFDKFEKTEDIIKSLEILASEIYQFGRDKEKTIHIKGKLLLKLEVRFLKTGNKSIVEGVLKAFEKEEFSLYKHDKSELETATLYKGF